MVSMEERGQAVIAAAVCGGRRVKGNGVMFKRFDTCLARWHAYQLPLSAPALSAYLMHRVTQQGACAVGPQPLALQHTHLRPCGTRRSAHRQRCHPAARWGCQQPCPRFPSWPGTPPRHRQTTRHRQLHTRHCRPCCILHLHCRQPCCTMPRRDPRCGSGHALLQQVQRLPHLQRPCCHRHHHHQHHQHHRKHRQAPMPAAQWARQGCRCDLLALHLLGPHGSVRCHPGSACWGSG